MKALLSLIIFLSSNLAFANSEFVGELNLTKEGIGMGEFIRRTYDLKASRESKLRIEYRKVEQINVLEKGTVMLTGETAKFLHASLASQSLTSSRDLSCKKLTLASGDVYFCEISFSVSK
jgi:hypothetical protein